MVEYYLDMLKNVRLIGSKSLSTLLLYYILNILRKILYYAVLGHISKFYKFLIKGNILSKIYQKTLKSRLLLLKILTLLYTLWIYLLIMSIILLVLIHLNILESMNMILMLPKLFKLLKAMLKDSLLLLHYLIKKDVLKVILMETYYS